MRHVRQGSQRLTIKLCQMKVDMLAVNTTVESHRSVKMYTEPEVQKKSEDIALDVDRVVRNMQDLEPSMKHVSWAKILMKNENKRKEVNKIA